MKRSLEDRSIGSNSKRFGHLQEFDGMQNPHTNHALEYVKTVKSLYLHEDKKEEYDEFCRIVLDFKNGRLDIQDLIARVKELFRGHHELILDFKAFLPKEYAINRDRISPRKSLKLKEAKDFLYKVRDRFQHDIQVATSFTEILSNGYKCQESMPKICQRVESIFQGHNDLIDEFRCILFGPPATNAMPAIEKGRGEKRKITFTSSKNCDHEKTCIEVGKEKKVCVEKEREKKEVRDEGDHAQSEGIILFEKIKEKLCDVDAYRKLLKCLDNYKKEIFTLSKLQTSVADILGKYPDFIRRLNQFLAHCENLDGFLAIMLNENSLWNDGHLSKRAMIEDWQKGRDHERDEVEKSTRDHEGNEEKKWERIDKNGTKNFSDQTSSLSELDLSKCRRCTPSYCLLPKNYKKPPASYRTDFDAKVLNDNWVSITSGSEDSSFKLMRKNPYEEALFRCEDDRYEADMLLESINSTARCVEKLLEKVHENASKPEIKIDIKDHLTAMNLRCIERLYDDYGADVIDILLRNASRALPTILARLKQKKEELLIYQLEYKQIWADVYAKNCHKSLDHCSFYFKQLDKKRLSTKALLAEIKETNTENSKEEGALLAMAAGNPQWINPSMEFEYSDSDVNEDLYHIISYSCMELCKTREQLDTVMKIWTTFLEPMLEVPPRPQCGDSIVVISESGASMTESKLGTGISRHQEASIISKGFEVEREEGELTPDGYFKEDNFVAYGEDGKDDTESSVFYGNNSFYVFFRLHQMLYERILLARKNSSSMDLFSRFMSTLCSLLDGSIDLPKFEDDCRAIIGTQAYQLFTLDNLIFKIVKQLQVIVEDVTDNKLLQLYASEKSRMPERFVDKTYHENALALLPDENVFRFEFASNPCRLSIRLMEGYEKPDAASPSLDSTSEAYFSDESRNRHRDEYID